MLITRQGPETPTLCRGFFMPMDGLYVAMSQGWRCDECPKQKDSWQFVKKLAVVSFQLAAKNFQNYRDAYRGDISVVFGQDAFLIKRLMIKILLISIVSSFDRG